jgi:hypothetical protein
MPDTRRPSEYRPLCDTRGSVVAAWFIFVLVVWPILTSLLFVVCFYLVVGVYTALGVLPWPESAITFGPFLPFVGIASPIAAAIACYKACRLITVPLSESKPLAFEASTVVAVIIAMIVAIAFWAWIWEQAWTV